MIDPTTEDAQQHAAALQGAGRLALQATNGVLDVVEELHRTIAGGPAILGKPLARPAAAVTGAVYQVIRDVARQVGAGIDVALGQLAPLLGRSAPGPQREAMLAILNGVLGDYLHETGNSLEIPMQLRSGGRPLRLEPDALRAALPHASGKVLVLVHGSCLSDLQWNRLGQDHGAALARDLGFTPVYLRYNSGLHISTSGKAFSALLEQLLRGWPVPVTELVLLGHSMGGLVCRSACLAAEADGRSWRGTLGALVCLGTPHHGAPLERGGTFLHWMLGISRYSAPFVRLGRLRSAGVTDMRFGNLVDEDWSGRDRFALGRDPRRKHSLPPGVECYAIAATSAEQLVQNLPGDGLVPVDSALGRHPDPAFTLPFPERHTSVAFGCSHLDLLSRADVYETLRSWLSPAGLTVG